MLSSLYLEAHNVRGIQQYFEKNNIYMGLHQLKTATEGTSLNAIYIHGIIIIRRWDIDIGEAYDVGD